MTTQTQTPLLLSRTFKSMMLMCLYTRPPRRRLMSAFSRLMASNSCARWSSITSRGRRLASSSASMSCAVGRGAADRRATGETRREWLSMVP